ncbi:MAG: hypothetical protein RR363_04060 [Rikenellaceae bacterium]
MDYEKLYEVTVKDQAELNMIPDSFKGRVLIKFGTLLYPAIVEKSSSFCVVATGNSFVEAKGNSFVEATGNSFVEASENSSVLAWERSFVKAFGNSSVVACDNSHVEAYKNSFVDANGLSFVNAMGFSSVIACGGSRVEARENSHVVARGDGLVEAWGNAQVINYLQGAKIHINGNARIVFMPQNIEDFMDFYGIKHDKKKAIYFKAVKKRADGVYCSYYNNNFIYVVGSYVSEKCDRNEGIARSYGIHISPLDWALNFGSFEDNLSILEVETDIKDIVLPEKSNGAVRTSKCKVLREVPLDECGAYGKILAKSQVAMSDCLRAKKKDSLEQSKWKDTSIN